MKIEGLNESVENLEFYDTIFDGMDAFEKSSGYTAFSPEEKELIKKIDDLFSKADGVKDVPPLKIDKDGNVDFSRGYYFHNIPIESSEEGIVHRSQNGILPTERFGYPEGSGEMYFCVGTIYSNDFLNDTKFRKMKLGLITFSNQNIGNVSFIIDPSITDYMPEFYSYIKNPDKSVEHSDILEFLSRESKNAKGNVFELRRYDLCGWRAIIGGIPPQFVVGVVCNTSCRNSEGAFKTAKLCSKYFNIPIVDQNGEIITSQNVDQME